MRHGLVWIAVVAMAFGAGKANAQLAYSLETGSPASPDGFVSNNGGVYTQDIIGTTHGLHSMKVDLAAGDTFVGALNGTINPAPGGASIFDPPGVDFILFDLTIAPGQEFPPGGGFAVVGVTIFGCTQGGACGNQAQFNDIEHIDGKVAGLYPNVRIDLNSAANFLPGQSFNQIFGASGSGSPLIPTHFQLFFNKSAVPLTFYIDNIRVGQIPEPTTCVLLGMGTLAMTMVTSRRRSRAA
jgi:hypothetical protein